MNETEQTKTEEAPSKELKEPTPQEIADLLATSHLLRAFEKISKLECEEGDILIFRFNAKVPDRAKQNLARNFDNVLRQFKLRGFFIPPDLEFEGAISARPKESNIGEVKTIPLKAEATNGQPTATT